MSDPITTPQLEDLQTRARAAGMAIDWRAEMEDVEPLQRMIAATAVFNLDAEDYGLDPVEAFKQILSTFYPNKETA